MKPDPNKFSLLFVDDEKNILSSLKRVFIDEGYILHTASSAQKALNLMAKMKINAALIDLKMPDMDGLSLLKIMHEKYPVIMVAMLTGHGSIKDAVKAIRHGAADFVEKPFVAESLVAKVHSLFERWQLKAENQRLKKEMGIRFKYEKLIGNAPKMLLLKEMISKTSQSDVTVLIQSETGTGKELVAKALHHHSPRSDGSFIVVDCATVNESMLESELFGHVKGAFTGAHQNSNGLVAAADKGTLFFDEIGELPLRIQAKLLRVIQEKGIRSVGSNKSRKVDIRIIAATNRDLKQEIVENRFREDLYYRLETVNIHVPPLRDRASDILPLIKYFINMYKTEFTTVTDVSTDALAYMEKYSWPGNVRELENLIRRVMALSRVGKVLLTDLPVEISGPNISKSIPSEDSLAAYEKAAIKNALQISKNHRKDAARLLKIGEATLYRKIKAANKDPGFLLDAGMSDRYTMDTERQTHLRHTGVKEAPNKTGGQNLKFDDNVELF